MNPRDEDLESWHKPKPVGVEFEATKTYKTYKKTYKKNYGLTIQKLCFDQHKDGTFNKIKVRLGYWAEPGNGDL